MLNYKAIEIFTSEAARWRKKSVSDAVIQYIRELKIAARCIVTRGIAGCYESGEMATTRLEILSFNQTGPDLHRRSGRGDRSRPGRFGRHGRRGHRCLA